MMVMMMMIIKVQYIGGTEGCYIQQVLQTPVYGASTILGWNYGGNDDVDNYMRTLPYWVRYMMMMMFKFLQVQVDDYA